MDKIFARNTTTADCRMCLASIAVVYSPLALILTAAAILF